MKYLRGRILALGMAICLCLGLCAVSANAVDKSEMPEEEIYGEIDLSLSLKKSGGNYTVSCKAETRMVEWLATAAAVCKDDPRMADLRFTCTLHDALTEKLSSGDVTSSNYEFSSVKYDGSDIFVLDTPNAVKIEDGSLKLRYKLDTDVLKSIGTAKEVTDTLRRTMTMTSKNMVIPASDLEDIGSTIRTTAEITITSTDGNIPFYDEESIPAAKGKCNTSNPEYSSGGGIGGGIGGGTGGGTGGGVPTQPQESTAVEVVDKTPSTGEPDTGSTSSSYIPVGGGTTTVENPDAKPGEQVRVKTESDKGSMVNYITVKDENGKRIPLTYDGKGKFSFEMPESGNVTIEASYRVIPADPKETGVADLLDTDSHILYMIGDENGDFRPNAEITRAEVATAFFRLLRNQDVEITAHFNDVEMTDWYVLPVETLASLHIIEGVGNGAYEPDRAITRAEFAAIAARFANKLIAGASFADVDEDAWYATYVSTAANFGWINGIGNDMYEPDRPITRTEAATIINRMLFRISDWIKVDEGHGRQFPDISDDFWGKYEISEATNGHDHTTEEEYFHEDWIVED